MKFVKKSAFHEDEQSSLSKSSNVKWKITKDKTFVWDLKGGPNPSHCVVKLANSQTKKWDATL